MLQKGAHRFSCSMFTIKCLCMCNAKHFFCMAEFQAIQALEFGRRVQGVGLRGVRARVYGQVCRFLAPQFAFSLRMPLRAYSRGTSNNFKLDCSRHMTCTTALAKDDMEPFAGPFCRAVVFTGPLQGPFETGLPFVHHKGDCLEVQRSTTYLPLW